MRVASIPLSSHDSISKKYPLTIQIDCMPLILLSQSMQIVLLPTRLAKHLYVKGEFSYFRLSLIYHCSALYTTHNKGSHKQIQFYTKSTIPVSKI